MKDYSKLYDSVKSGELIVHNFSSYIVRFWHQVNKERRKKKGSSSRCWEWTGLPQKSGYCRIRINSNYRRVHQVSWEMHFGKIPDGMCVCHKCDNKICVNPSHLFLGTNRDNQIDKVSKGRQAKGERCGNCKLTSKQVIEIRKTYVRRSKTHGMRAMIKKFGVGRSMIKYILNGTNWKHLL